MGKASALPSVSVIIPAYNAAPHIARAIESALAQSATPLEIIVVDDGSTDDTAELVMRRYPQVTLLRQDNRGCGPARNTACAAARADWLAFLDADDEWMPTKLEKQLVFAVDPRVAVINARRTTKSGTPLGTAIEFDELWRQNELIVSSTLVRRDVFEAAGGFWAERYCEDYHLWLRLAGAGWTIANCPEDLVLYLPTPGSLSQQTEQFAAVERLCLRDAAARLNLPSTKLNRRLLASYLRHAKGAIVGRQAPLARGLILQSFSVGLSAGQLGLLAVTILPSAAFDARRRTLRLHGDLTAKRRGSDNSRSP